MDRVKGVWRGRTRVGLRASEAPQDAVLRPVPARPHFTRAVACDTPNKKPAEPQGPAGFSVENQPSRNGKKNT
jgi:hypothetical protein